MVYYCFSNILGDWDTSRVTCWSKSIHGFHAGSMPLVADCEIFHRRFFEGKNLLLDRPQGLMKCKISISYAQILRFCMKALRIWYPSDIKDFPIQMPLIILTDLQWRASPDGPKIRMSAACEAPNVPSEAVEDHRFCTDCWEAAGRLLWGNNPLVI